MHSWGRSWASMAARLRSVVPIVLLMAISAASAVLISATLFPHLSANGDESVYLAQADALRHGDLFLPARDPAEAFQPWLSAIRDGHYVTKYTPPHPAVIAAVLRLGAPRRAALGVLAAMACLGVYVLALQVLDNRRIALLACALLLTSPLFLIQSGTYLPYVGNVALLSMFAAATVHGRRTRSRWSLSAGGLLLGVALFARPYDAALFCIPFLVWLVVGCWRRRRDLVLFAAGLVPPLLVTALYFRAATGSAFRIPFQLLDPSDTVGFGQRRIYPGTPYVDFTPAIGLRALLSDLDLFVVWCSGGVVVAGLAVFALRRTRTSGPLVPLAFTAVLIPLGYAFFWGSAASLSWSAPFDLGPWYWMPALVPLVIFGARGAVQFAREHRRHAPVAAGFVVVFSTVVFVSAARKETGPARTSRHLWSTIAARVGDGARGALIFLPGPGLGNPVQDTVNGDSYDGRIVWARDLGPCTNAETVKRFEWRQTLALTVPPWWLETPAGSLPAADVLRPMWPGCTRWERDSSGQSPAALHSATAVPATIITPKEDAPNPFLLHEGDTS